MSYCFTAELSCSFEEGIERAKACLDQNGFGVISEINVHEKFEKALGVKFRRYQILGACSPGHAHRALTLENKIGTMLPCNVIVQEHEPGKVEVSAIDPIASMQAVQNPELADVALEIQAILRKVKIGRAHV